MFFLSPPYTHELKLKLIGWALVLLYLVTLSSGLVLLLVWMEHYHRAFSVACLYPSATSSKTISTTTLSSLLPFILCVCVPVVVNMRLVPCYTDNDAGSAPRGPETYLLASNILPPPAAVKRGAVVMDGANVAWGRGISHPNLIGTAKALDWFESHLP